MTNFRTGYLEQGAPLGAITYSAVLGADDTALVVDGYSMIFLSSDTAVAADRTFTLSGSTQPGQLISLIMESGAASSCQLLNSGNCKLVAAWTPVQYESLNLRWDGTYWIEMGRSKVLVPGQANIAIADLAPEVMAEAAGTLAQADIIAMNGTPVTLIAAPGAGKAIVIDEVELRHTYSTAQYTGGGDVSVQYTTGSAAIVLFDATIVTAASSTTRIARPTVYDLDNSTGTAIGYDILTVANSAVSVTNAAAVFAAGNAANILKYRVRYHVVTLQA